MRTFSLAAAACAAAILLLPLGAQAQHTGGGSPVGVKDRADDAEKLHAPTAWPYRLGGSSVLEVNVSRDAQHSIQERLANLAAGRAVPRDRLAGVTLEPGHVVPREKVRIRRLPAEIVKHAPEYGSYEYFVVEGGSIVIVDPRSYEIVEVIAA